MTNKEAIEALQDVVFSLPGKYEEALQMAIAAMEKQEAKKPFYNGVDYECPYCNTTIVYGVKPWHCDICGQKIWWTEGE